jgi:hypothetical protein
MVLVTIESMVPTQGDTACLSYCLDARAFEVCARQKLSLDGLSEMHGRVSLVRSGGASTASWPVSFSAADHKRDVKGLERYFVKLDCVNAIAPTMLKTGMKSCDLIL